MSDHDDDPSHPPFTDLGSVQARRDPFLSITAFAVVLLVYVALGVVLKSVVLNWIVGPFFPVAVLYLVPRALRRRAP